MASHSKIRLAAALLAGAALVTAANAGDYSNASTYNAPFGLQPGQENAPPNTSLRDANGNLQVVNGQFTSANFGSASGAGASASGASSAGGVGTSGAGTAFGNATAIGNQLNVVTLGNNNTVVVNATQNNSGNQTATNTVNGH
ncbi:MAG TPA: holdfast anchoring protein HfaA [Rhizomicrobium sp.]|jgi:holdfast attachment protein HfaA|nr:holdfast anchoring protein HfaA [Rhizomicrobium sp.]